MNNSSLIDTTKDYFENDEFLKIFQKVYSESAQEFAILLDEVSKKYSSNLYWWVSLTASRSPTKSPLYKEFCIIKSIQSFNLLYGKKFQFLVSSSSQKLALKQNLGKQCPEIHVTRKKESLYQLLKHFIRPTYFFLNKFIHLMMISFHFSKIKIDSPITLAEVFLSPTENYERYYPGLENFLSIKKTKNIYFVPTIINTNFYNLLNVIKTIQNDKKNYLFRELYLNISDLLDAVGYKKKLHKLASLNNSKDKSNQIILEILIHSSLKSEPFNSLSAEGILNYKFLKNLNQERRIEILNFIDWWENTPMDKAINIAMNSFFPKANTRGYMGFVPNKFSFQLSPSKQERLSNVIPKRIGVIGEAFLPILKRFDFSVSGFVAPAFRFEHLKNNVSDHQKYFLILPSIDPDESKKMIDITSEIAKLFPDINFIIKPHPGTGKLSEFQDNLKIKNLCIDNLSSVDKLLIDTKVLVTSSSSAALEGIVRSTTALILNHSKLIPENIVPDSVPAYLWESFDDVDSLKKIISQLQFKDSNSNTKKDAVNLNYYFNLPNNKNVDDFFKCT
tara:strand:- start:6673 stop:8355 length:1683 start_codon:yes stop_codon:yes gene_type:complete